MPSSKELISSRELVKKVAQETGLSAYAIEQVLTSLGENILNYINDGKTVRLRCIGTFDTVERASKDVYVPSTGETVKTEPHKSARIKPCSKIRKGVE